MMVIGWLLVILDDDNDENPGIMLAHFLFFVYWISHMVVFCIASLFAKLTIWQDHDMLNDKDGTYLQTMGRIATFLVPSLTWLMTKYKYYYLSLNLLFLKLTTMVSSIAYFYSLLNPGDHTLMVLNRIYQNSNFLQGHWIINWFVSGSWQWLYSILLPVF